MLRRIHIRNFRSFRDFSLDLGRNNVVVGPNMSGKSNLVDFFKFVKDLLAPSQPGTYGIYSAFNPRNGFSEVTWRGEESPVISFVLDGYSRRIDGTEISWVYSLEIIGNFQYNNAAFQSETLEQSVNGEKTVLIETRQGKRLVFDARGKQISEWPDSQRLALEAVYPDWPGNEVRTSILSWKFYSLLPPLMKQPNPTAVPPALNVFGDNLSAWLMLLQTKHSESFERIKSVTKDAFPGLSDLFTSPTDQAKVFVASRENGLRRPTPAAQMSDGELAFIALLSLIFAPLELGSDIYFVEEPENHLHPRLISTLIDILHQVQQELGPAAGQVIVTTHSLQLIDKFGLDDLVLLKKENGATIAVRPKNAHGLREMLESQEIGLGDLYFSGALSIA